MTFVFTGQLESTDRDTATAIVKRYGGKVTTQPSSRTTYVVLGDDAGPRKLEMIKKHNCATLNEDEFLDLLRTLPPRDEKGKELPRTKKAKSSAEETKKVEPQAPVNVIDDDDDVPMEVDPPKETLLNTSFDKMFNDVKTDFKNGVRSGQQDNKRAANTKYDFFFLVPKRY